MTESMNTAGRAARWSALHWKRATFGWLFLALLIGGTAALGLAASASALRFTNAAPSQEGTITVTKDLIPSTDPGRFSLKIDNTLPPGGQNVGDGGTTGPVTVPSGEHTVSEVAIAGTDLNDYTKSIRCVEDSNPASPVDDSANPGAVFLTVADGDDWQCTITNSRGTPTAVRIASLRAERTRAGVLLRWRTASEADMLGFNVYRKSHGKLVKLNRVLIPSLSGGITKGHRYSWLDRNARHAVTYTYRIQAVSHRGTRVWPGTTVARRRS